MAVSSPPIVNLDGFNIKRNHEGRSCQQNNLYYKFEPKPTNLKISGNLDPTFYYSGKLSIPKLQPSKRHFLHPRVNFPKRTFSIYTASTFNLFEESLFSP